MRRIAILSAGLALLLCACETGRYTTPAAPNAPRIAPFLAYLASADNPGSLIALSPTNHDPREGALRQTPSPASLRADLEALRPAFDGFILYSFDEDVTPILLAEAARQHYRAVLLGIWDPSSSAEIEGVAKLVRQYHRDLALGVCIGNEGIYFGRYAFAQVEDGRRRLGEILGPTGDVAYSTSEPLVEYADAVVRNFGDFLAPNIHPIFDRPDLDAEAAAAWTRDQAKALAVRSGRSLLVKETGFPHGGEPRFTPSTQAAFWRAYVSGPRSIEIGPRQWLAYAAAFEAFDLPWKAEQTGMPVEAYWGVLRTNRDPLPAFRVWEDLALQRERRVP
jgi:exo-beta-1,3-glucanase (GH17 family)